MTRHRQKSEEVYRVEQMRRALGGSLVGTLDPGDEPDVCILASDRRVGVEVTQLHQDSVPGQPPKRLRESERAQVAARARALAEDSGMPVVNVALHFNDSVPVTKADRDMKAGALVELVSKNLPTGEEAVTVDVARQPSNPCPCVRSVRLYRAGFLTK